MTASKIVQKEAENNTTENNGVSEKQEPNIVVIREPNLWDIPNTHLPDDKRAFYPNWDNEPPPTKPIIHLANHEVLTLGNYLVLMGGAGIGKSSICEAIAANIINADCDALGFHAELSRPRNKVLYIDCERSWKDTWSSWQRAMVRAEIVNPHINKRMPIVNIRAIKFKERKKYVDEILGMNPDIGLVMFDGATSFISDVNSISETTEFSEWIYDFNPNLSLLMTIHTNPFSDKARGTLGSELWRYSETSLLIRKVKENPGIREITTDYDFGKVRNDDDQISVFYGWSASHKMMMSTNYTKPAPRQTEKKNELFELAKEMFDGKTRVTYKHMTDFIEAKKGITYNGARKVIGNMIDRNVVMKIEVNVYELTK